MVHLYHYSVIMLIITMTSQTGAYSYYYSLTVFKRDKNADKLLTRLLTHSAEKTTHLRPKIECAVLF